MRCSVLGDAVRKDMGLPPAAAERAARNLLRHLSREECARLRRKAEQHPVLSRSKEWVWVTPGNVPEPIALAIHCARLSGADLTLKVSRKMLRTGRALVRALRVPGRTVRVVTDPDRMTSGSARGAAWVVYGKDSTLQTVRGRLPAGTPWLGHGERFSISVIFASALDADPVRTARRCAQDIWQYDQRGCLSAQLIWVEGDPGSARTFGEKVLAALLKLRRTHGPVLRDREHEAERRNALNELAIRALDPGQVEMIRADGSPDPAGPAIYWLKRGRFTAPTAGQVAGVKAFTSVAGIARQMRPFFPRLQGIAVAGREADRRRIRKAFARSSAVYFPDAGELQSPPIDWQF